MTGHPGVSWKMKLGERLGGRELEVCVVVRCVNVMWLIPSEGRFFCATGNFVTNTEAKSSKK
jgi:hypothetical protein